MIKKYRWKCRVLLIKTPNYKNLKYKKAKKLYQTNIKQFHKRVVKLISKKTSNNFSIELFGFDLCGFFLKQQYLVFLRETYLILLIGEKVFL